MSKETNNPKYWLAQAGQIRELAKDKHDALVRDILEEIAIRYERVAELLEQSYTSDQDRQA